MVNPANLLEYLTIFWRKKISKQSLINKCKIFLDFSSMQGVKDFSHDDLLNE